MPASQQAWRLVLGDSSINGARSEAYRSGFQLLCLGSSELPLNEISKPSRATSGRRRTLLDRNNPPSPKQVCITFLLEGVTNYFPGPKDALFLKDGHLQEYSNVLQLLHFQTWPKRTTGVPQRIALRNLPPVGVSSAPTTDTGVKSGTKFLLALSHLVAVCSEKAVLSEERLRSIRKTSKIALRTCNHTEGARHRDDYAVDESDILNIIRLIQNICLDTILTFELEDGTFYSKMSISLRAPSGLPGYRVDDDILRDPSGTTFAKASAALRAAASSPHPSRQQGNNLPAPPPTELLARLSSTLTGDSPEPESLLARRALRPDTTTDASNLERAGNLLHFQAQAQ